MDAQIQRMRSDWDQRALDDPAYWVYMPLGRGNRDLQRIFDQAAAQARALLTPALHRLSLNPAQKSIVEIGCGFGRFFPGFQAMGFHETWGVDVSERMLERAREWCPVANAHFLLSDGVSLAGVPTSGIDVCFSYNVLPHVPHRGIVWAYLREAYRVLSPGGVLALQLRGGHTRRERILLAVPRPLRPRAKSLFGATSLLWFRARPQRRRINPGSLETLELGAAITPGKAQRFAEALGFQRVEVHTDDTYHDGTRYWLSGCKP